MFLYSHEQYYKKLECSFTDKFLKIGQMFVSRAGAFL